MDGKTAEVLKNAANVVAGIEDLELIGYEYPVKVFIQGNIIALRDNVGREILRPQYFSGGYFGRIRMYKVVELIAKLLNEASVEIKAKKMTGEDAPELDNEGNVILEEKVEEIVKRKSGRPKGRKNK